jgi:hypothetical protein
MRFARTQGAIAIDATDFAHLRVVIDRLIGPLSVTTILYSRDGGRTFTDLRPTMSN